MKNHPFQSFSIKPFLVDAIDKKGFQQPTEIQQRVIPMIKKGRSVIGQSKTGSGKSHAFLLPVVDKVDPSRAETQVVIAAPTRELATQLYQVTRELVADADETYKVKRFVGGTDKARDIEASKDAPHIVIGTPGRLRDLVKEQALSVHKTEILIVDEADIMLDMGFIEEVDQIASRMPENLQMCVFSATIPEKLQPFLQKYMEDPRYVQQTEANTTPSKLVHWVLPVRSSDRLERLYDVCTSFQPYLAIIFTNTKKRAEEVHRFLTEKGLRVGQMHGDLAPRERARMLKRIQSLEFQYVVATDLASRGIDLEGASHVINDALPKDLDFYVHRAGRTGRAQYEGVAITLVSPDEENQLDALESRGLPIQMKELKKGEWKDGKPRHQRTTRKMTASSDEKQVRQKVYKSKKVKPGYKKKYQRKVDEKMKQHRRKQQRQK